jgi:hypothetical protein
LDSPTAPFTEPHGRTFYTLLSQQQKQWECQRDTYQQQSWNHRSDPTNLRMPFTPNKHY